jgi:hypothetical protein
MSDRIAELELRLADLRRLLAECCDNGRSHLVPLITALVEDTETELLGHASVTDLSEWRSAHLADKETRYG